MFKILSFTTISLLLSTNIYAFRKTLSANTSNINSTEMKVYERNPKYWHEIKETQGGGRPVIIKRYGPQNVFWFEATGTSEEKERSEVRVRGADVLFNKIHYLKLNIFLSVDSDVNPNYEWNLISQCAQIYTVPKGQDPKSPPFSLHIKNQRLKLRTITDYTDDFYPELDLGRIRKGRWVSIWVRFKLGVNGSISAKVNGTQKASVYRPIGYNGLYSPVSEVETERCSFRFGIYRDGLTPNRLTRILFKDFSIGTDYIRP